MRKLANDFPLDAVVFVLPDVVVLLLPPPPQPAAITASPAHSAAAVTSRFQEMLRFKIDLPVFTVPLSAGCILTDYPRCKWLDPFSEAESLAAASAQLVRLGLLDDLAHSLAAG